MPSPMAEPIHPLGLRPRGRHPAEPNEPANLQISMCVPRRESRPTRGRLQHPGSLWTAVYQWDHVPDGHPAKRALQDGADVALVRDQLPGGPSR
jgi:hypothetical protein